MIFTPAMLLTLLTDIKYTHTHYALTSYFGLPGLLHGSKVFQYLHLPKEDFGKLKKQIVDVHQQEIKGEQVLPTRRGEKEESSEPTFGRATPG